MKRIATFFLLVACLALNLLAQSTPEQKNPDKDADKKQVVPSSTKDKKKSATDEKKEEPKKEEEKKPGMNAETFSGNSDRNGATHCTSTNWLTPNTAASASIDSRNGCAVT